MEASWKIQSGSFWVGGGRFWELWKGFGWSLVEKALMCIIFHLESIKCHECLLGKPQCSFSLFFHRFSMRWQNINFHYLSLNWNCFPPNKVSITCHLRFFKQNMKGYTNSILDPGGRGERSRKGLFWGAFLVSLRLVGVIGVIEGPGKIFASERFRQLGQMTQEV